MWDSGEGSFFRTIGVEIEMLLYYINALFPKVINSIKFVVPFRVGERKSALKGRNCPGGARTMIAQGERPKGANPGAGKGRLFAPRRGATVPTKYIGGEIVAPFQGAMPRGITYPW